MSYLLFDKDYTKNIQPSLGDGSKLKLCECEEGWFCEDIHKDVIDLYQWPYSIVSGVQFIEIEV
jgi:hypothetical protein